MNKNEPFLIYFFIMSGLLICFMIVFDNAKYIHIYSLFSITISILISRFVSIDQSVITNKSDNIKIGFFEELSNKKSIAFIIVSVNLLLCIFSLIMLSNKIDFAKATQNSGTDVKKLFLTSNIISIIIVQFGGWFLQSVLLYFTSILFDLEIGFSKILNLTGIAYVGFLLSTIILYIYNYFVFTEGVPVDEFKEIALSNIISPTVGKLGEYVTLSLVAFFIFNLKANHLNTFKTIVLTAIPSFVLLTIEQIFKYAF